MANFVKISEAASLGLHTMALLAKRGERRTTNQEIAEMLGGSVHHLAKVMQRLVRAGLVDSAVGPQGGFRLAKAPEDINLSHIYEAIEGPLGEPGCLLAKQICGGLDCVLGDFIQRINRDVRDFFTERTLATLVDGVAFVGTLEDETTTATI